MYKIEIICQDGSVLEYKVKNTLKEEYLNKATSIANSLPRKANVFVTKFPLKQNERIQII